MKQFLTCYLVCLVGLVIFTFFGGLNLLFFSNAWASIAFYALVLALILHLVMSYEERLEKLEKRVKELESAGAEEGEQLK